MISSDPLKENLKFKDCNGSKTVNLFLKIQAKKIKHSSTDSFSEIRITHSKHTKACLKKQLFIQELV